MTNPDKNSDEVLKEGAKIFLEVLIDICEALGDAVLGSDDGGDEWIEKSSGRFDGEIRSTHLGDTPVWEIVVRPHSGFSRLIEYRVERSNDPTCKNCLHKKSEHEFTDKQGCHGIADYERETNSYIRCHCFDFEMVEVEG